MKTFNVTTKELERGFECTETFGMLWFGMLFSEYKIAS